MKILKVKLSKNQ